MARTTKAIFAMAFASLAVVSLLAIGASGALAANGISSVPTAGNGDCDRTMDQLHLQDGSCDQNCTQLCSKQMTQDRLQEQDRLMDGSCHVVA
jgi:hypothetical protein